jgi:hypothetical protein
MRRLAITVGKQGTWHVIVQMIPFATCAMFLDMWLDNVQNPTLLETAVVVAAFVVVVVIVMAVAAFIVAVEVVIEMLCAGTANNLVI